MQKLPAPTPKGANGKVPNISPMLQENPTQYWSRQSVEGGEGLEPKGCREQEPGNFP